MNENKINNPENKKNEPETKKDEPSLQTTLAILSIIVGMITSLTAMITAFRTDPKLHVVTIGGFALFVWLVSALYIVYKKGIERFNRLRPYAFFSIGCVAGIFFSFFLFPTNRQYFLQGINGTLTATVSPTSTPYSLTATLTPTFTATSTPTLTFTPIPSTATSIPILGNNCFNNQSWKANDFQNYTTNAPVYSQNGCWDLSNWGFFAHENGMTITQSTDEENGLRHDIYIPISVNSTITFMLNVERFTIPSTNSGYLVFGIINYGAGNSSLEDSRVIHYRYQPNQSENNFIQETYAGTRLIDTLEYRLNLSTIQKVEFSTSDGRISVSFDGDEPNDFKINDFGSYAFWIGYALPQSAEMEVHINDFKIKDNTH